MRRELIMKNVHPWRRITVRLDRHPFWYTVVSCIYNIPEDYRPPGGVFCRKRLQFQADSSVESARCRVPMVGRVWKISHELHGLRSSDLLVNDAV